MGIKEVKPDEPNNDNILAKKNVREIGSVGLDELVQKVQAKLEQKVEKVSTENGAATETKKGETAELKKAYFNKVGVEKNMETSQVRALRGSLSPTALDPKNLKLIVLPKAAQQADPAQISTLGDKANILAPFRFELGDLLGNLLQRMQKKPKAAEAFIDKLKEKAAAREKKFGKKVPPADRDPTEYCEELYNERRRRRAVIKMYEHLNKALGQKMDTTGAPTEAAPGSKEEEDGSF